MADPASDAIDDDDRQVADRVHSAALHLLRRLRKVDDATGLSAPRASALSVLVSGPTTLGNLARVEQVSAPTITRLIAGMERDGLVRRENDRKDQRVVWLHPTAKGARLLKIARERRVGALAAEIARISERDRNALLGAAKLLERFFP